MVKKRKGRSVRRNQQVQSEPEDVIQAPHSFIIHRGLPGGHIVEITKDFRKVMEPFTASTLKERKKNTIKDFVQIASVLHVSHMCIFTRTDLGMYLKIAKLPRGPTLTFKVHSFTLAKDVVSSLKKQFVFDEAFKHSPLIVLNSFSGEGMHMKLMATTFQNMFPTINLTNINLNTIRRVVLLNYNPTTKLIEFRHYAIKVIPVGVSKGVKKVVQGKVPNLARCDDIADFLTKTAMLSESEFEDDATNEVTLPQKLSSRGNMENKQSAIRLSELGPRLTMQLMKVEDGLLDGEVLFHELVHKTEEEVALINKKREQKKKLKEYRKKQQDLNTQKKEEQKEVHKQRSLEGMQKKGKTESDRLMKQAAAESNRETQMEDDDDAEYYRQEVGEEPEKDLFSSNANRKRPMPSQDLQSKKPRFDNDSGDKPRGNKFDNPRGNKFDKPYGNKFDKPQGNKFDKPRGNKFDKPNGNKFDKSRGNKFDKPRDNKFDKPRGNKFDKPRGNKFDNPRGNKFDKSRDNKFDKKKGFKPNRRSDGSPDKKWPGGRGGNPRYGLNAHNGEDDDQSSFAGKKGKGKPQGGKVHGSKVNKMKNKRR